MAPSGNDKVCSYHDVLLRASDVDLVKGPHWLNDQITAFYVEYLRREHAVAGVCLLDASTTFLLASCVAGEARMLLEPLGLDLKNVVCPPLPQWLTGSQLHNVGDTKCHVEAIR